MLSIPRLRENKATSDGQRKKLDFCFLLKKKKIFFFAAVGGMRAVPGAAVRFQWLRDQCCPLFEAA